MKKTIIVSFVFVLLAYLGMYTPIFAFDCQSGYPHVAKKNGTYDNRENDLWELAQDWVFYRNRIISCNQKNDKKCVAKSQNQFQQINNWLNQYPEEHVKKALELAAECRR